MKKSIKTKLILLYFVLISIPIILLGSISYNITSKEIKKIVEQDIRTIEIKTARSINEKIHNIEKSTEILTYDLELPKSALNKDEKLKKNCFSYIHNIQKNNSKELEDLWIVDLNGNIVFTSKDLNPKVNLSNRQYIKKVLNGTPSKSQVILSKVTNKPIVSVAYPLKIEGKVTGAVVGVINFENISKYVKEINVGKKGYGCLFDKKGLFIYHPDKNKVLKENILETDSEELKTLVNKSKNNDDVTGYFKNESKKYGSFIPIGDLTLFTVADYDEYMQAAINIKFVTIVLSLIFILISLIIAYTLINKSIIKPILHIGNLMNKAGSGDLTVQAHIKTGDELEDLANSFNEMILEQNNIIQNIRKKAENLTATSEELAASSQEVDLSSLEVANSINSISQDMEKQNEYILNSAKNISELSNLINLAENKAIVTKENSQNTLNTAEAGHLMIDDTVEAIYKIDSSAENTASILKDLENLSTNVEGIISTINSISEQTNLLALNAAIEAARAGEHGKGFAVVADEVRKLSEESNKEANKISTLIKEMVLKINKAVTAMDLNKEFIEEGVSMVKDTDSSFVTIIYSVKQIAEDINKIVSITKDEVTNSEKIVELVDNISLLSQNTTASSEEIASAAEEQSSSTESLSSTSQETSNMAMDLITLVEKFNI